MWLFLIYIIGLCNDNLDQTVWNKICATAKPLVMTVLQSLRYRNIVQVQKCNGQCHVCNHIALLFNHPSIFFAYSGSPILTVTGQEREYTLGRSPVCHRAKTQRQTIIKLTPLCWRKPEYLTRIHAGRTCILDLNQQLSCCDRMVLITASPCHPLFNQVMGFTFLWSKESLQNTQVLCVWGQR